ncbi:MAG: gamma-glutamyltransferase [Magnetococcales bacterium]|nr:gamma-glutamyltransferase [Magnetococcales bacterium]
MWKNLGFILLLLCLANIATAEGAAPPEPNRFMIVAANPLAVEAGYEVLKKGGSALDAAVAVQMVLSLVEPQSSGIGGGAFLLHWDNTKKKLSAYDGRETAPAAARANRFLLPDSLQPQAFYQAVVGGLSVGVPGVVGMLGKAHENHGRTPWAELFTPARDLAQDGFVVSPRLSAQLTKDPYLKNSPTARFYFYNSDGTPKKRLVNPAYAQTLQRLAERGAEGFYTGSLAEDIVDTVRHAQPPGDLTLADMRGYEAKQRQPICHLYRTNRLCSIPPPTSGGIAVLQLLGILDHFEVGDKSHHSAEMVHLFTQAQRLVFADRDYFVADSDFVPVPIKELLDGDYLKRRAKAIDPSRDRGKASRGNPQGNASYFREGGEEFSLPSTSHISIVDGWGSAVSMTTSVENRFGSRLMVGGFLLNNQLTDFTFVPTLKGQPVANRVEPGKRPRSSMAPVMVFDLDGNLRIVAGSPGGSRIIGYVAQTLWNLMAWGLDPQSAVAAAHVGNRNGVTELEKGTSLESHKAKLESMGHSVIIKAMTSGLNVITLKEGVLQGGTDPRREGRVMWGTVTPQ